MRRCYFLNRNVCVCVRIYPVEARFFMFILSLFRCLADYSLAHLLVRLAHTACVCAFFGKKAFYAVAVAAFFIIFLYSDHSCVVMNAFDELVGFSI